MQVDGYFADDSTHNTESGKNHDAQFVLRFPDVWNGKLLVTGAPGVRKQYATDRAISDWAVAHGYAYAATDKGNSGNDFYTDSTKPGKVPGDSVLEWHQRVTELTIAAKDTVRQVYGRVPDRTYMTGISNGGYLTRWALEHHPELYDGGVDWEGTLFTARRTTCSGPAGRAAELPDLAADRQHRRPRRDARCRLRARAPRTLWKHHEAVYWDLTQRVYREEFDPAYDGATAAGTPFCQAGTVAAAATPTTTTRAAPQAVRDAVDRVSLTGKIGKPMLTLHGTLDTLLPIREDSDVYDRMVDAGRARPAAPLLRRAGRQPRRPAGRRVPDRHPADAALLLRGPRPARRLGHPRGRAVTGRDACRGRPPGDVANSCALPKR